MPPQLVPARAEARLPSLSLLVLPFGHAASAIWWQRVEALMGRLASFLVGSRHAAAALATSTYHEAYENMYDREYTFSTLIKTLHRERVAK